MQTIIDLQQLTEEEFEVLIVEKFNSLVGNYNLLSKKEIGDKLKYINNLLTHYFKIKNGK